MHKPPRGRTPLPRGMLARRRGFYYRRRRGGKDELIFLHTDRTLAESIYHDTLGRLLRGEELAPKPEPAREPQPEPERMSVVEAAARWLANGIADRNPKNAGVTRSRVRLYLEEFFRNDVLEEVRAERVLEYRVWLGSRKWNGRVLGRETVRHILADARCMFRWLEDHGHVPKAPLPRKLMPKPHKVAPRWLSDAEVETLLAKLDGPWLFVVRFGLASGLRWSEMCRSEAKHLDRDGQLIVPVSKSGEPRKVPIGDIDPELTREISRRVGRLVPYAPNSVGTFNRRVKAKTGILDFSHHRLRHTFATRWLSEGRSIVALQTILGHSDLELTQRYARTTEEFIRAEARKVRNGDKTVSKSTEIGKVVALQGGTTVS